MSDPRRTRQDGTVFCLCLLLEADPPMTADFDSYYDGDSDDSGSASPRLMIDYDGTAVPLKVWSTLFDNTAINLLT